MTEQKFDWVTSVLAAWIEPELLEWKLRVGLGAANRISKKAIKTGSRVDELIGIDIDKDKYNIRKADNAEVRSCMAGWELFKEREAQTVVSHHIKIRHAESLTSGEYDLEFPEIMTDIKAANRISKKYWIQTAWYNYMSGLNKPYLGILRLDPFWKTYEFVKKPMNHGYLRVFEGMLHAYRYFSYKEELE